MSDKTYEKYLEIYRAMPPAITQAPGFLSGQRTMNSLDAAMFVVGERQRAGYIRRTDDEHLTKEPHG